MADLAPHTHVAPSVPAAKPSSTIDTVKFAAQVVAAVAFPCLMVFVGWWGDPARVPGAEIDSADRILFYTFVVFAVGLGELFVLFMGLAIFGKIDLAKAFEDKDGAAPPTPDTKEAAFVSRVVGGGVVSLSRLQAFLWTLIVMVLYFHRAVKYEGDGLPTIPDQLLLVMGISGAVYLASKQMTASATDMGKKPDDEK